LRRPGQVPFDGIRGNTTGNTAGAWPPAYTQKIVRRLFATNCAHVRRLFAEICPPQAPHQVFYHNAGLRDGLNCFDGAWKRPAA
jgi:hypothetical protein